VGAVRDELPGRQAPQLSQLAERLPGGDDWISEIKFDGYRLLGFLADGKARNLSWHGLDRSGRLTWLAHAIAQLKVDAAIQDCELVAFEADGILSFADLQCALSEGHDARIFHYNFHRDHLQQIAIVKRYCQPSPVAHNHGVCSGMSCASDPEEWPRDAAQATEQPVRSPAVRRRPSSTR